MRQDRAADPEGAGHHGEAGFSLVEMMLAFLLLALMLAGTAGTFIAFMRASVVNETRVGATAYLNELHEELQSTAWDQAALYREEIDDLQALGVDVGATDPSYDGGDLILLEGPNEPFCGEGDATCDRLPFVPLPYEQVDIDGREYEVFRLVTARESHPDIKRFVTVIRWEVLGREIEESFQSLRAPDASILDEAELPDVLTFDVTPSTVQLDEQSQNEGGITIEARFSRGIDDAEVRYAALDDEGAVVERTLPLTGVVFDGAKASVYEGSIAGSSDAFPEGPQTFHLVGFDGVTEIPASTQVMFNSEKDWDLEPPPVVATVSRTPGTVNVGQGPSSGQMQCTLRVEATVDGLDSDGTVVAKYSAGPAEGRDMELKTPPITGSSDTFELVFGEGTSAPWSGGATDRFTITAKNPDGAESGSLSTQNVSFTANNSGSC